MKLAGKVAVITGGSSGIGLATAQEFVNEGANVVISGRNPDALQTAVQQLGPNAHAVQGDVANMADLDRLFAETKEKFGTVDVLVVNAGLGRFAPVAQMTEEEFDHVMDINFKGAFFTIQKALPIINDNASIILITSAVLNMSMPGSSVYTASKAAVDSLVRIAAVELVERGIRVNSLSPGPIATAFFSNTGIPQEQIAQMAEGIQGQVPLQRFGKPEEMAKAALFLASSDSSYVVGTEILADGGISL